jgi:hypothetical protein
VDGRRRFGTGLFAGPLFFLALAAGYRDGLGNRQKEFANINSGKILVNDAIVLDGTGFLAEPAADTFQIIYADKAHALRSRVEFLAPDRLVIHRQLPPQTSGRRLGDKKEPPVIYRYNNDNQIGDENQIGEWSG